MFLYYLNSDNSAMLLNHIWKGLQSVSAASWPSSDSVQISLFPMSDCVDFWLYLLSITLSDNFMIWVNETSRNCEIYERLVLDCKLNLLS